MPLGSAKVTRKKRSSAGNAEMRKGGGEGGGGPDRYGRDMLAGHAKLPEPKAAEATAFIVKQKARNT